MTMKQILNNNNIMKKLFFTICLLLCAVSHLVYIFFIAFCII